MAGRRGRRCRSSGPHDQDPGVHSGQSYDGGTQYVRGAEGGAEGQVDQRAGVRRVGGERRHLTRCSVGDRAQRNRPYRVEELLIPQGTRVDVQVGGCEQARRIVRPSGDADLGITPTVAAGFRFDKEKDITEQQDDIVRLVSRVLDRITGDAVLSGLDQIWLLRRRGDLTLSERDDLWPPERLAALAQPFRRASTTFSNE